MITNKEKAVARVQAAHGELALALAELRASPSVVTSAYEARAVSLAITHAETSWLWFRASVMDGPYSPK